MMDHIINFFTSKSISISSKIIVPIIVLTIVLFANDFYGVSYYFFYGKKIDYLDKIERMKVSCKQDKEMFCYLDSIEKDAIQRKSVIKSFFAIFENTSPTKQQSVINTKSDIKPNLLKQRPNFVCSFLNKIFPEVNRNQIWHTITAALVPVALLLFLVVAFIPYLLSSKNTIKDIIALLSSMVAIAAFIWLLEWLFGLIPVLFHRAYINYILQIFLNILITYFIYKKNKS